MSNSIKKVKKKLDQTALDYSIPSYNYVEKLPTPGDNGVGASGDVGTLLKDIIYMGKPAIRMFFGIGSNNPKKYPGKKGYYNTGGALGNYYRLPAGFDENGKKKWMCIDNISRIPFVDGIVPGMMKDVYDINPFLLLQSVSDPSKPVYKECFQNFNEKKNSTTIDFFSIILLLILLTIFMKLFS